MRTKNVLLGATLGVVAGFITAILGATATKLYRVRSEGATEYKSGKHTEGLPPGFVWIDGMDLDEVDEDVPYFNEGDTVYLVNPHNGGYWIGNSEMGSPTIFEVQGAEYDEDDVEWRYKLRPRDISEEECGLQADFETELFAEKWLDIADKPGMKRKLGGVGSKLTIKVSEIKRIASERGSAVSYEIDYLLDTLNHSTDEEEREQALARLEELTEGDGGE